MHNNFVKTDQDFFSKQIPDVLLQTIFSNIDNIFSLVVLIQVCHRFRIFINRSDPVNNAMIEKIFLNCFPHLAGIFGRLITPSLKFYGLYFEDNLKFYIRNLYRTKFMIDIFKEEENYQYLTTFYFLLDLGNFQGAAKVLQKNNHSETLLRLRSYSGKSLITVASAGLSVFPLNGREIEIKKTMTEDKEKGVSLLFKTLFIETIKTEFPDLKPDPINITSIVNTKALQNIKDNLKGNPSELFLSKAGSDTLRLLIISYTCRQFNIFTQIRDSFVKFKINLKDCYPFILSLCVEYSATQLMQLIFAEDKTIIIKTFTDLVSPICRVEDLTMLKLVNHYEHKSNDSLTYDSNTGIYRNTDIFEKVSSSNPLLTMGFIPKIKFHQLNPHIKKKYFRQIIFLDKRNLNELLNQWKKETCGNPDLEKKRSQELLKLMVPLLLNYSPGKSPLNISSIIMEIVNHSSYDLSEKYNHDPDYDPIDSENDQYDNYVNLNLIEIVERLGFEALLKDLKSFKLENPSTPVKVSF